MKYYYFAYGSNMNLQEMKKYVNNNMKIIGIGKLHNYIFKYRVFKNRRLSGKANIEKHKNSNVYGIIYEIRTNLSGKGLERLHKKEGYFNLTYLISFYNVKLVYPLIKTNKKYIHCFSYFMNPFKVKENGKPSIQYQNNILKAAKKYNLPETYIKKYLTYF